MNILIKILGVACLGLVAWLAMQPATLPSLVGSYSGLEKRAAADTLAISRDTAEGLRFTASVAIGENHRCRIDGVAGYRGVVDGKRVYRFEKVARHDPTQRCMLDIVVGVHTIQFLDPKQSCRAAYCGSQGSLDGVVFDRLSRTKAD